MIKSALLALLVLVAPAFAEERPLKIATVDMQQIFKSYHRTEAAQKDYNVEIARIQKQDGERLSGIRDIGAQLEKLVKQLDDPTVAESKKVELQRQATDRKQEGLALERERRDFIERQRTQVNERMVQVMKGLLAEIRKQLDEISRAEDYDYVFDSSGVSASQVPFVLSSRESGDLTEMVLTKLNAGAAKEEAEPASK
ncbi:OmpH family outer membrane protein [Luteolibacter soli]|uniref:OmpH family outer membrane protein n=1 Tax=Luteolibacter soli TaxID=3135280 RepID=A0ABU9ATF6_9BACT